MKIGRSMLEIVRASCYLKPRKVSKFIMNLFEEVMRDLNNGKHVLILGESYGGLVVSQLAKLMARRKEYTNKIDMATFGSVYIPTQHKTQGVKIHHFLHVDDIALMCNKVRQVHVLSDTYKRDKKNKNIIWFRTSGQYAGRWDIHTSTYRPLLESAIANHGLKTLLNQIK